MTPGDFGLEFHHLGLAVTSSREAVDFLRGLGYQAGPPTSDPLQKVEIVWCSHDMMPDVEVLSPCGDGGPLDGYLKAFSEVIYHMSFSTEDVASSVRMMKEAGHRIVCVSEPKEAVLFDGRKVSFYMVRGFGLIEIIQL